MKRTFTALTYSLLAAGLLPSSAAFSLQRQSLHASTRHVHAPIATKNMYSSHVRPYSYSTRIKSQSGDEDIDADPMFNGQTTIALVAGQSLLIVAAIVAANILVSL